MRIGESYAPLRHGEDVYTDRENRKVMFWDVLIAIGVHERA